MIGCIDLWFRYYNPHLFFATQIAYAVDNITDITKRNRLIKDLIRSAKERNIETVLPSLERRNVHADFDIEKNTIYLGLNNIAGAKPPSIRKVLDKIEVIEERRDLKRFYGALDKERSILDHSWIEVLLYFSQPIGKKLMDGWIRLGMFDKIDPNRQGLLYDYHDWMTLSPAEKRWIESKGFTTLDGAMNGLVQSPVGRNSGCTTEKRKTEVRSLVSLRAKNRPRTTDQIYHLQQEATHIGVTITQVQVTANEDDSNITLLDLDKPMKNAKIAVYITEVNVKKDKNGNDMLFVGGVDNDGNESNSLICFSSDYHKVCDAVYAGAFVMLKGEVSNRGSFIINGVETL
jgi:DNA polymerase III alpha subunit